MDRHGDYIGIGRKHVNIQIMISYSCRLFEDEDTRVEQQTFKNRCPEMKFPLSIFADGMEIAPFGKGNKEADTLLLAPLLVGNVASISFIVTGALSNKAQVHMDVLHQSKGVIFQTSLFIERCRASMGHSNM